MRTPTPIATNPDYEGAAGDWFVYGILGEVLVRVLLVN